VGMTVVIAALEIYLAWTYRAAFAPMLRAHVEPSGSEPVATSAKTTFQTHAGG
jgi:hypothetical protein